MDLNKFDVEFMGFIFLKRLSAQPLRVHSVECDHMQRNDPTNPASGGAEVSNYGDDTHNYGLGHEGRKHRMDIACLNCSRAVPLAAVGASSEATPSGCTCSFHDGKRIKQGDLELKQDPFGSSWEANSHSQIANSSLFSVTEHSALGPDLAKDITESKGTFTSFDDFISFSDDLPSLEQKVGCVADGKSSLQQPLDGSFRPYDRKVEGKASVVKGNAPTAQQWEIMRPRIKRLYIDEGRTLASVLEELREDHGFSASYLRPF